MRDRLDEGADALRRYLGKGLSIDDDVVQHELRSIRGAIQIERQSKLSFKEVISNRDRSGHLKRLLLGCGGQFMQVCKLPLHNTTWILTSLAIRRHQRFELLLPHHPHEKHWPDRVDGAYPHRLQCHVICHLICYVFLDD